MLKRLLTLLSLFLCAATGFAQNTLNVHQKDGTVAKYGFSEKPTVTYTDTGIRLATTKVEEIKLSASVKNGLKARTTFPVSASFWR